MKSQENVKKQKNQPTRNYNSDLDEKTKKAISQPNDQASSSKKVSSDIRDYFATPKRPISTYSNAPNEKKLSKENSLFKRSYYNKKY